MNGPPLRIRVAKPLIWYSGKLQTNIHIFSSLLRMCVCVCFSFVFKTNVKLNVSIVSEAYRLSNWHNAHRFAPRSCMKLHNCHSMKWLFKYFIFISSISGSGVADKRNDFLVSVLFIDKFFFHLLLSCTFFSALNNLIHICVK